MRTKHRVRLMAYVSMFVLGWYGPGVTHAVLHGHTHVVHCPDGATSEHVCTQ